MKNKITTYAASLLLISVLFCVFSCDASPGLESETLETYDFYYEVYETEPPTETSATETDPTEETTKPIEQNEPVPPADKTYYEDVPVDHWACRSINTVTELGFMKGTEESGGTRFGLDDPVAPIEVIATIYNLCERPPIYVTDEDIRPLPDEYQNKWYSDAVTWAAYEGVIELSYDAGSTERIASYIGYARYSFKTGFDYMEEYREAKKRSDEKQFTISLLETPWYIISSAFEDNERYFSKNESIIYLYFLFAQALPDERIQEDISDYKSFDFSNDIHYDGCTDEDFYKACNWAVKSGIINGYPDGTLGIGKYETESRTFTKAELAVIIDRVYNYVNGRFSLDTYEKHISPET